MKQRGFYSYKKEGLHIRTKYEIEFTRDQKIIDRMDKSNFDFSELNKLEFDYLEDAINTYNLLYYDESVLHVMLFEQILLNNEIVLEQSKDMTAYNILPRHIQNRIEQTEQTKEYLQSENNLYKNYLDKFGITISKIRQEQTSKK